MIKNWFKNPFIILCFSILLIYLGTNIRGLVHGSVSLSDLSQWRSHLLLIIGYGLALTGMIIFGFLLLKNSYLMGPVLVWAGVLIIITKNYSQGGAGPTLYLNEPQAFLVGGTVILTGICMSIVALRGQSPKK